MILEVTCPSCGTHLDGHEGLDPADVPSDGDVSVCYHCDSISVYASGPFGLWLRRPTGQELDTYMADDRIRTMMATKFNTVQETITRWRNSNKDSE